MDHATWLLVAADAVLIVHVLFVLFVIFGLVFIIIGAKCQWQWVRNRWFRLLHLSAILYVLTLAWLGKICPLTTLEMELRARVGDAVYEGGFIAHWLQEILYYDAPLWFFTLLYSAIGLLTVACWIWVKPRPFR